MNDTEVKSIRIVDPHTIAVVERFQRRTGISTATKAAAKMIERLDAIEPQASDSREGRNEEGQRSVTVPTGEGK